jgi:drug/metabolite transporter (DMT)-like permease
VKYLRPTIVGSMPLGEPILATLLAWMLFSESIDARVALGGIITLFGLLVINLRRRSQKQ